MENLYFAKEQLAKGVYAAPLPPTRKLAQIAVADIGAVAVRVLEDAGRFTGKRFDLAGDELTGNDVVAILSRVTGRPFAITRSRSMSSASAWARTAPRCTNGWTASATRSDRAALRREFPDVAFHDFESWAKAQDWRLT